MYDELEEFFAPVDPNTEVKLDFTDYMTTGYASTLTSSKQMGSVGALTANTSSISGTTNGSAYGSITMAGTTASSANTPLITTSQPNSTGAIWVTTPNISGSTGITTYPSVPYGGGSISVPSIGGPYVGSPYNTPMSGTWNINYPGMLYPGQEAWPQVADAIGIVFIDGDLIKIKSKNGKEVIIGRLDDSTEDIIPIEVVAAKKKLLEGTKEEQIG